MSEIGRSGGGCGGSSRRGAYISLALMVLIGSSTATSAKFALRELPVELLPLVRFGVAGLCLFPIVNRDGVWRRMLREDGPRALLTAAFCVPINQTFFLNGTRLAPTTHVGLIYAAVPVVVLLLAWALGQERLVPRRLLGVLASVSGVAVIGIGNLWSGADAGRSALRGDLLLVGAVVAWGVYLTLNKPLIARHGAIPALAATFLLGCVLDLPIALATLPSWRPLSAASPAAWGGLLHLTLVATLCGLTFQNLALRRFDASQVATFGNVAPILTVVWGAWLFGEPVTPALVAGGVLTLVGIFWTTGKPPAQAGSPALRPEAERGRVARPAPQVASAR